MQIRKLLVGFFSVLLLILTGCSNGVNPDDQYIEVQKRVGKESNFEEVRKITDRKEVLNVREILNETKWVYAKRDTLQPPDYRFSFQSKDPRIQADAVLHRVWITPDKNRLVIVRGENQYAQLTKKQSAILLQILTKGNSEGHLQEKMMYVGLGLLLFCFILYYFIFNPQKTLIKK